MISSDASSMAYKRVHKTKAPNGYYHAKDGMMRLWMSEEEYDRIGKMRDDQKKENQEVA